MASYIFSDSLIVKIKGLRLVMKTYASLSAKYQIDLFYDDGRSYTISFDDDKARDKAFTSIKNKLEKPGRKK